MLDAIKTDVEAQSGRNFARFNGVKYTTQVVAGVNYLFSVHIDGDEIIHVKVSVCHNPIMRTT